MDVQSYKARYGKKLKNTAEQQKCGGGISKKGQERRLKWYGHVMEGRSTRKEGDETGTTRMRKTGRLKRRWLHRVRDDIR